MSTPVLLNATATGAGSAFTVQSAPVSIQATVSGTGAVSATVVIQVSNDGANWITMGTIILAGTTSNSDGFTAMANWALVRANLTAVSGTGATVVVVMNI